MVESQTENEVVEVDRELFEQITSFASSYLVQAEIDGAEGFAEENRHYVEQAREHTNEE